MHKLFPEQGIFLTLIYIFVHLFTYLYFYNQLYSSKNSLAIIKPSNHLEYLFFT